MGDDADKSQIVGFTSAGNRPFGDAGIPITQGDLDKAEFVMEELFGKTIQKSSRHSKITGDFAEHIVLYWLSKYGYECARIDHVGVDLIARDLSENVTMGISVKSRSREYDLGTRAPGLIKKKDIEGLLATCEVFNWQPYVAFVVDSPNKMYLIMCSLRKYLSFGKTTVSLKGSDIKKYKADPDMKIVEFNHSTSINW